MQQAYIKFPQSGGTFLYRLYDATLTVAQESAAFALLTYAQKVAACVPNPPADAAGFKGFRLRIPSSVDVFGYPRTLIGAHNGYNVYTAPGLAYLLERYQETPDQFAPKGVNLSGLVLVAGATLPTGETTAYGGQVAPAAFIRADAVGYRLRYFGGNVDQKYYELSDLADETIVNSSAPAVGATAIVSANADVLTVVAENNGTKWRIRKTSTRAIPGGNQEYIYINGELKTGWGGYDYLSGDQVSIMYVISTDTNTNNWTTKGYALVTLGDI